MSSRVWLIAIVGILLAAFGCEAQPQWVHIQLTDSEYPVGEYSIDGDWVAWVGNAGLERSTDIFLFDGKTVRQLSSDNQSNTRPIVSNGYVVWQAGRGYGNVNGLPGHIRMLNIYDGQNVRELRTSVDPASPFDVSGSNIVWIGHNRHQNREVFLFDGKLTHRLTEDDSQEGHPRVSGNSIVWRAWDLHQGLQVYQYREDQSIRQLSEGPWIPHPPHISGDKATWAATPQDGDTQVFFYDGRPARQLTNRGRRHDYPRIDGSNVVWQGFDGNDWEIFLFDGQIARQITNNNHDDTAPRISGNNIVWIGQLTERRESFEIFFYDGSAITRVTNNDVRDGDPIISGSRIVYGRDDNGHGHIMVAVPANDPWAESKPNMVRRLHEGMIGEYRTRKTGTDVSTCSSIHTGGLQGSGSERSEDGQEGRFLQCPCVE